MGGISDWLSSFGGWMSWFAERVFWFFGAILQAINPFTLIVRFADFLMAVLPPASTWITDIFLRMQEALGFVVGYISYADYFVDAKWLVWTVFVMLTIESMILGIRIWRLVRSFFV